MKKKISIILCIVLMLTACVFATGCEREADEVSYNVSLEADNFNVQRRLAVINTVTNEPVFEMTGLISITADTDDNQLEVIVEVAQGVYKKHIIGLNQATTMYVVEDINGTGVDRYNYTINYNPKQFFPYKFKVVD